MKYLREVSPETYNQYMQERQAQTRNSFQRIGGLAILEHRLADGTLFAFAMMRTNKPPIYMIPVGYNYGIC